MREGRSKVFPTILTVVAFWCGPSVARARVRPLTDFLQAQGTISSVFFPVPDYLSWTNEAPSGPAGSIDYAGLANQFLIANGLPSLGTKIDGNVEELPLSDGTAQVTIVLHTTNALAFVTDVNNVPLFGYLATQLAPHPTLKPAIGDSHLKVVIKNSAPGAPLPDLICLVGACPMNFELLFISFYATATGPLRSTFGVLENTPGRLSIVETGLFALPELPIKSRVSQQGGFPVERVDLKAAGK